MAFGSVSRVAYALAFGLAVALVVGGSASVAAEPHPVQGVVLAGYAPGEEPPAAVLDAPGELTALDEALGLAVIKTPDVAATLAALEGAAGVQFAHEEGAVRAAGLSSESVSWDVVWPDSARWDSARWDSARWDSARWDSARWDSARWDSARWDSARWDSARWDSARWDSARWDSARWDSARWDSARWDSARWDGSAFEADPLLGYQWGLESLKVPQAWSVTQGSLGSTLCVVDSGVDYTHPDLAPNMWAADDGSHGWNFVADTNDPMDDAGHGTHMAGVAAAAVGNGIGTAGVGNARIQAVKVLDATGVGAESDLALGIRWCADHGADVIGLSLSTHEDSPAVRRAVDYAWEHGALMVASAGNVDDCSDCTTYPAAYEHVLSVAALTPQHQIAWFSEDGDWVDVAAPGAHIVGPFLDGGYALGSGTSQAAALVAGAAALALDANPDLTNEDLTELLLENTRGIDEKDRGEPDVHRLVRSALRHK